MPSSRRKDRKRNSVPILGICIEICEEMKGQLCWQLIDNLSKEEGHTVSKHFVSHTGGRMTKDDEEIERSAASIGLLMVATLSWWKASCDYLLHRLKCFVCVNFQVRVGAITVEKCNRENLLHKLRTWALVFIRRVLTDPSCVRHWRFSSQQLRNAGFHFEL